MFKNAKQFLGTLALGGFVVLSVSATELEQIAQLESDREESPTLFFYHLKQQAMDLGSPTLKNSLERNVGSYLKLDKMYSELSKFGHEYGTRLGDYIKDGEVVTGYHLHLLAKTFTSYHLMSYRSLEFGSFYAPGNSTRAEKFIDFENLENTKMNLVWLSSSLNLFDKFLDAYSTYYKRDGNLRRMLKHIFKISKNTKKTADELKEMVKHSIGKKNREVLKKYLTKYLDDKDKLAQLATQDADLAAIMQTIDGNPSLELIKKNKKIKLKSFAFVDSFAQLGEKIVNTLSGFFGNMADAVRWRKGFLWENMRMIDQIQSQLKPLDIIYEKTPFALTDTFIPGYFGHSALWLGTEEELKELGMWNHPSIAPYQDQIRLGNSIVEALRPGVSMNTIRGFMNIDHIAIMRVKNILEDKSEIPEIYERAMRNMGADYDFNFDVTTTDKIVCSELIYHTFGKIRFPTKWRLGRPTIEPDLIAEVNYYDNSPLEFLFFVESFGKDKIDHLQEQDLGRRLGFSVNKERSTDTDLAYDKESKKCRTLKVGKKLRRVCTTKYEAIEYKAPELLTADLEPPTIE